MLPFATQSWIPNSWISLSMSLLFLLGYLGIGFEHRLKVNKAAFAVLTGTLLWLLCFLGPILEGFSPPTACLSQQLASISEIIFFLMSAMILIELIDAHNGFALLANHAGPMNRKKFCFVTTLVAFFMSSIIDNLTTTLVLVTLLRRLIADRKERMLVGGLVVIAANAGGAWTPIGDITTTMLWLKGNISPLVTIQNLFLPSLVTTLVAWASLTWRMKEEPYSCPHLDRAAATLKPGGKPVLFLGILTFLLLPLFKTLTHLPAYMGLLLGLALLWVFTDCLHKKEEQKELRVFHVLKRIDSSTLLFFLGILLAVSALEQAEILQTAALALDRTIGSKALIVTFLGLLSAFIDNVPLVAASMSMYSLQEFSTDHPLWHWIAFCAGTGGSTLIVGSAAGIALMGLEKVPFGWYARHVGLFALFSYFSGLLVLLLQNVIP